jgi:hypothetical protein
VCYFRYRFTKIAVDQQVRTPDGKAYDVLFIGTGMPAFYDISLVF